LGEIGYLSENMKFIPIFYPYALKDEKREPPNPLISLVPGAEIEPARAQGSRDFKGENRGWRKSLISLQNLRLPLNFNEEVDND
jgi:hypothetical protein